MKKRCLLRLFFYVQALIPMKQSPH